ncbi:hypothetical protein [Inquilinus limosus]|uniref:Lipoprotein n=1 Tax=Inquilinus limosus MP06 TaxID=1398085 RepID=A0A0A0DAG2_9PROT|nr:hypothetical protein [Inquilinus limosus]KGM35119.1 hypothetical protein P409_06365 [Inquilinus limosus MP06]
MINRTGGRAIAAAAVLALTGLVSACNESPAPEVAQPAIARCADQVWATATGLTMPAVPSWMKPKSGPDLQAVQEATGKAMQQAGQAKVTEAIRTAAKARTGDDTAIEITGTTPLDGGFRLEFSCTVKGDSVTSVKSSVTTG